MSRQIRATTVVSQPPRFSTVVAETPRRTRVELEHRDIDRHGPGWEAVSDGVGGDGGWPLYLSRYANLISEEG